MHNQLCPHAYMCFPAVLQFDILAGIAVGFTVVPQGMVSLAWLCNFFLHSNPKDEQAHCRVPVVLERSN